MKCKKCGYNDQKPLGKAIEASSNGKVIIELKDNCLKYTIHKELCLKNNKKEGKENENN